MQRLLHPDPDEIQRIKARNIYCPALQASISPEQCKVNQRRAKKKDWENSFNIFAYDACKDCPGATPPEPEPEPEKPSRKHGRKCNQCGRVKDLQDFETNPQTKELYRSCQTCRKKQFAKKQHVSKKAPQSDTPLITVTSDGYTMLINRKCLDEFQIASFSYVQILSDPLRIRLLHERIQEPHVCKLTSKGNTKNPHYTLAISRMARDLQIPANEVFTVERRKDGMLLLCAI